MKEHLNKTDWKVPNLSGEEISAILDLANKKVMRRNQVRRIAKSAIASCVLIIATIAIYNFYPRSIDREMSVARQLLQKELDQKFEPRFFADRSDREHSHEEGSHAFSFE